MRRLILLSAIAAACGPVRHDVEIDWTFDGVSCSDAGVESIRIAIAGEALDPDTFSCAEAGAGVDLGRFLSGKYQVTIDGLDATGAILYETTQPIDVTNTGANKFAIDVPSNSITLKWTFAGQSCDAAGITSVNISVDGAQITDTKGSSDIACKNGTIEGVTIAPLAPGDHVFDLVGNVGDAPKYVLSGYHATAQVAADVAASVDLDLAASANLTWTFDGQSCAAANVDHVQVFFDPHSDGSGGADSGTVPCTASGVDGTMIFGVPEGTHSFAITGIRSGHIVYFTHHPPSTQFHLGYVSDLAVSAESP